MNEDIKVKIEIPDCAFQEILKKIRNFTIIVGRAMGKAMKDNSTIAKVSVKKQTTFTVKKVTDALISLGAVVSDDSTDSCTCLTIDFSNMNIPF